MEIARDLKGIQPAKFPGFIEPALATLSHKPPSGEKWVHEIKFDGYRAQLHKRDAGAKMFTRRGYDAPNTPSFRSAQKRLQLGVWVLPGRSEAIGLPTQIW